MRCSNLCENRILLMRFTSDFNFEIRLGSFPGCFIVATTVAECSGGLFLCLFLGTIVL